MESITTNRQPLAMMPLNTLSKRLALAMLMSAVLLGSHAGQVNAAGTLGQGYLVNPTPLQRPNNDSAMVRITTNPGGAQIYINGNRKGNSPDQAGQAFAIKLAEGSYHIQVVKPIDEHHEYRGESTDVYVADFTSPTVNIDLSKSLTPEGIIAKQKADEAARIAKQKADEAARIAKQKADEAARIAKEKARIAKQKADAEKIATNKRLWSKLGYVDNKDGTITDTKTNLTWMRCSLGQTWTGSTCSGKAKKYSWQAAINAGKQTTYAGKSDWRVPTIDELRSLVYCSSGKQRERRLDNREEIVKQGDKLLDGSCEGNYQEPTIFSEAFPNAAVQFNSLYWSSSTHYDTYRDSTRNAWEVHFLNGRVSYSWKDYGGDRVRFVRSGQ